MSLLKPENIDTYLHRAKADILVYTILEEEKREYNGFNINNM